MPLIWEHVGVCTTFVSNITNASRDYNADNALSKIEAGHWSLEFGQWPVTATSILGSPLWKGWRWCESVKPSPIGSKVVFKWSPADLWGKVCSRDWDVSKKWSSKARNSNVPLASADVREEEGLLASYAVVLRLVTRSSPRTSAQRTGHFRSLAVSLCFKRTNPLFC